MMQESFNSASFNKMSEYVYRKTGILLEESKHFTKLDTYIKARSLKLGIEGFRKYFFKLRFEDLKGEEFQELMNAITVNETYFFREENQFDALVGSILPELDYLRPSHEPIRILSAPCSTGEEPFSMVIKILEEANIVNKRDIEIIGIDIDSTVIEKAMNAKYSDRSIHAIPPGLVAKYFKKTGIFNQFSEELKGAVDFKIVNIFDKIDIRKLGKFDVIFSRNMLIYFDDASRKEVAMTFYDMLKPNGYVLLGHAEYMSRIVSVFKAKKINDTLVYQK